VSDGLPEELVLVGEVEVDGALGDPGAPRNLVEGGIAYSSLAEDLEGRLEDLLRSMRWLPAPLRSFLDRTSLITDQSVS
jgi:hypothetical protein